MKKLKSLATFSLFILGIFLLTCCESSNKLTTSSHVTKGQLDNGFTYYIKENHFDKSKAALRLIVKAGSALEREDQRGLAHFIEHMVFRGTENFSDGEVISFLESIGASFGADTNAYTAFDETVYHLDIPLDKEDSMRKGLQILADFSSKALFQEEVLEKEKKVVLDELRLRMNNASGRVMEKDFEFSFSGTQYAHRLPGGLVDVVKNSTRKDLMDFYKTWYRPDNMALVVVGDFDKNQILEDIENIYSGIQKPEKTLEKPKGFLKKKTDNQALILKDAELIIPSIKLTTLMDSKPRAGKEDLKEDLLQTIAIGTLNTRLVKLTELDDSPFKNASIGASSFSKTIDIINIVISPWENKEEVALNTSMGEFRKFLSQGLTEQELNERVSNLKLSFSTLLENKDKQKNEAFVQDFIEEFLYDVPSYSIEEEVEYYLSLLQSLTLDEVNSYIKNLNYEDLKWSLVYMTQDMENSLEEKDFLAYIGDDHQNSIETEVETVVKEKKFHVEVLEKPGQIIDSKIYKDSDVEELVLSNGLKVYLQQSDLKKNIVNFTLFAEGGYDCIDEESIDSASISAQYGQKSGLKGLTTQELTSALSGRNAHISYNITTTERNITGACSKEDTELAFQLIYALFKHKYYRDASWNQLLNMYNDVLKTKNNNPEYRFYQDTYRLINSNHYIYEDPNLFKMDKDKAKTILESFFSDPSEFSCVIVGDFDKEAVKKHLETYLGFKNENKTSLSKVFHHFEFPSGVIEKISDGGVGEKSQSMLAFPLTLEDFKESKESYRLLNMAVKVLNQRLREKIRNTSGETYGIDVSIFNPFFPKITSSKLLVSFSCDPKNYEKVIEEVKEVLASTYLTPISDEEFNTAKELYKQNLKSQEKTLSGLSGRIEIYLKLKEDLNSMKDPSQLEDLTKEKVEKIFSNLINFQNYVSFTQKSRS